MKKDKETSKLKLLRINCEIQKIEGFIKYNEIIGKEPGFYAEMLADLKIKARDLKLEQILL
jgi:hypothetical protein